MEIDIEILDIERNIYERLGSLNISSRLDNKKVMMVGLGSVGSIAALQLAKSGVTDFTLVDPDILKLHNIIRHVCGLSDIGRYKVDAIRDKLKNINPSIKIHSLVKDCSDAYVKYENIFNEMDLFVVSTDTADSRSFMNLLSIDLKIPSVHIALHDRARSGSTYRIVPNVTGCKHCIGNGIWGSDKEPGTLDYSDAKNERDVVFSASSGYGYILGYHVRCKDVY